VPLLLSKTRSAGISELCRTRSSRNSSCSAASRTCAPRAVFQHIGGGDEEEMLGFSIPAGSAMRLRRR
jgi:hypothetical protein